MKWRTGWVLLLVNMSYMSDPYRNRKIDRERKYVWGSELEQEQEQEQESEWKQEQEKDRQWDEERKKER